MTHHEPKKEEKKEEKAASVEPIKPGDPRVVRKSSLLDTCYTTSSGKKQELRTTFLRGAKAWVFQANFNLFAEYTLFSSAS